MIVRLTRSIILCIVSVFVGACVALDNPFAAKTGTRGNACESDVSLAMAIERAKFVPPEIWSRLSPCELVNVSYHHNLDSWGISATLHYSYGDVLVYDAAMGMGVNGNLNLIGSAPDMEGWKLREDKKWLKHIKYRGDFDKRKVMFEARIGLECWRTETILYEKGLQSSSSIAYDCWSSSKETFPPLTIGGWIGYRDGKPLYNLDIDKDLIDPVFATLEVKDISPEVYAERMAIHEKKVIKDCKWRLKDVKKNHNRAFNAYSIKKLESCGYDTSKLIREQE